MFQRSKICLDHLAILKGRSKHSAADFVCLQSLVAMPHSK
jgi:hypothetical protein